jgi:hypothetical protein
MTALKKMLHGTRLRNITQFVARIAAAVWDEVMCGGGLDAAECVVGDDGDMCALASGRAAVAGTGGQLYVVTAAGDFLSGRCVDGTIHPRPRASHAVGDYYLEVLRTSAVLPALEHAAPFTSLLRALYAPTLSSCDNETGDAVPRDLCVCVCMCVCVCVCVCVYVRHSLPLSHSLSLSHRPQTCREGHSRPRVEGVCGHDRKPRHDRGGPGRCRNRQAGL